jgi:hypothetical protein
MLRVVLKFGFGPYDFKSNDFLDKDKIVSIGKEPLKIGILMSKLGIEFDVCYANRSVIEVDRVIINFIGLVDLIGRRKLSKKFD